MLHKSKKGPILSSLPVLKPTLCFRQSMGGRTSVEQLSCEKYSKYINAHAGLFQTMFSLTCTI